MGYRASVQEEANHSMKAAVEEVTNAEHPQGSRNFYCVSHGAYNCSDKGIRVHTPSIAPGHGERGLNVSEVAHDCQLQVARYAVDELSLCNSYDTWHGTKNAAKEIKTVCAGPKRTEGKI